ncbi:MAG: hypothetical protein RPT11_02915 [Bermanella sp.]
MAHDLAADGGVFFADFGVRVRVQRQSGGESELNCMIDAGIDRFIAEAYIKHRWEATVQVAAGLKKDDALLVLDEQDQVVAKYLLGDLLSREGDLMIFEANKKKLS